METEESELRQYIVTLVGRTSLYMHHDNLDWADEMDLWKLDPGNAKASKAGDDRYPPFRWLGCLYHDGLEVTIPSDNVMSCFKSGGTQIPTGKGKKTFKAQTQSGILAPDVHWKFTFGDGKTCLVAPLFEGRIERTWLEWKDLCAKIGFELNARRADVNGRKHVRARPLFDKWKLTGTLIVTDPEITTEVLQRIGSYCGQYIGLCDWRPGSKKSPGPFGVFDFIVKAA